MNPNNPESNYIRTYLDWLADMPWAKLSQACFHWLPPPKFWTLIITA